MAPDFWERPQNLGGTPWSGLSDKDLSRVTFSNIQIWRPGTAHEIHTVDVALDDLMAGFIIIYGDRQPDDEWHFYVFSRPPWDLAFMIDYAGEHIPLKTSSIWTARRRVRLGIVYRYHLHEQEIARLELPHAER